MTHSTQTIEQLLDAAERGVPGAARDFFVLLLETVVFVPPNISSAEQRFMTVDVEGHKVVPIFSRNEAVEVWAERELKVKQIPFKSLIQQIDDSLWLYLNPGQAVGKEISPWEIQQLRGGIEAVDELVAELGQGDVREVEVEAGRHVFPELKQRLEVVLEAYNNVDEGFLIKMKKEQTEESNEDFSVIIGLKQQGLSEKKRAQLAEEIHELVENGFSEIKQLQIADDLAEAESLHARLFSDVTPFYFRTEDASSRGKQGKGKATLFARLLKALGLR